MIVTLWYWAKYWQDNVVISIWCYWWSCLTLSVNLFWWFVLMKIGRVTFFFYQSNHVWPSLIPDDHLIFFLFPPVIHARVTRSEALSALLPFNVTSCLHSPSLLEEKICSILAMSTQSKPVQLVLIWLLKYCRGCWVEYTLPLIDSPTPDQQS